MSAALSTDYRNLELNAWESYPTRIVVNFIKIINQNNFACFPESVTKVLVTYITPVKQA
jgi:hypothetical protein